MTEEEKAQVLAARKLRELVEKGLSQKCLLSQMELEVEDEKRALGQKAMDAKLASLEPEDGRPKSCPRCGKRAKRRAAGVSRTFKSLSGEHTFRRDYYYCEGCSAGFFPRDAFLGLPDCGDVTIQLERRMADFAVNDTYEAACARWNFHYPLQVSANQFRQVVKRLGEKLEKASDNPTVLHSTLKPPEETAPRTLYVMNDGGMVPMRGEWSECKLAVIFRDDKHARGQADIRGQISKARYIAVLGGQEEFRGELQQGLFVENTVRAHHTVWVADGALGNWNLASVLAPNAIQILDWHHAVEHASDCGKVLLGEGDDGSNELWRARVEKLLREDVTDLLAELAECLAQAESGAARKALSDLIDYYENNRDRMRYGDYLRENLLIGSGPIESAHRHVIQARMKKAGQHWGAKGGRQMARLRAAYRTAGTDRFYDAVHWAGRMGPKVKKLSLFEKRRASNR
jgi:hypothetical protein